MLIVGESCVHHAMKTREGRRYVQAQTGQIRLA